jgi:hypothetical protein
VTDAIQTIKTHAKKHELGSFSNVGVNQSTEMLAFFTMSAKRKRSFSAVLLASDGVNVHGSNPTADNRFFTSGSAKAFWVLL